MKKLKYKWYIYKYMSKEVWKKRERLLDKEKLIKRFIQNLTLFIVLKPLAFYVVFFTKFEPIEGHIADYTNNKEEAFHVFLAKLIE